MPKRTVEIKDDLDDIVLGAIDEVKDELIQYIEDNDCEEVPDLSNDLDYGGRIHEIIDGSVPVYTHHTKDLWYLYQKEFESAYENAGVGDNPLENDGMTAIYYYIQDQVFEWYNDNAEEVFLQESNRIFKEDIKKIEDALMAEYSGDNFSKLSQAEDPDDVLEDFISDKDFLHQKAQQAIDDFIDGKEGNLVSDATKIEDIIMEMWDFADTYQ